MESCRLSGARPNTRVDTTGAFPTRPLATQSTVAQRCTTKPASGHTSASVPGGPKKGDVKASPEPQMLAEESATKHRPAPALSPATRHAPRLSETPPSAQESGTYACSVPVSNSTQGSDICRRDAALAATCAGQNELSSGSCDAVLDASVTVTVDAALDEIDRRASAVTSE
ncbi:hypothetical protein HPB50_003545 [Hyalomma asiaticum]|uniref:Uncharacterized protein n=1 Tax=Hyalomma asiaticum TaxID=266040 RepID=A0ACB7SKB3_HYAAI|nr:hypothetical protein HPB50_003545 [Hyalomma asiaticum]